jgi:hypothetical protein
LLFCYSGPVMVLFLIVSVFRHTLPHWVAAGTLAAYVAAPAALLPTGAEPRPGGSKWRPTLLATAAVVGAVESAAMPAMLLYPFTTVCYDRVRGLLGLPAEVIEPMAEATGWDAEIRDRIVEVRDRLRAETGDEPVVLTHNHMLAGLLAYGLRDRCQVVSVHAQAHQYDIWYDDSDVAGRPVIYVSSENSDSFRGRPEDFYVFEECKPEPELFIARHGITFNTVYIWVCRGYEGPVSGG